MNKKKIATLSSNNISMCPLNGDGRCAPEGYSTWNYLKEYLVVRYGGHRFSNQYFWSVAKTANADAWTLGFHRHEDLNLFLLDAISHGANQYDKLVQTAFSTA